MSVLYVSHGHPAFAKGGGELAAWRLFEAFRSKPGFEGSGFLAAASSPDQLPAGSEVLGLSPDEWLIKRSTSAITHDTAVNLSSGGQLHQALAGRCFQIIHLHHYLHVGIDLVLALKRWFPKAKLLLTLHDYWGPCVYEGRLLRASGELCSGGDPEACDQCLGGGRRGELAVRQVRLQRLISIIDHFICPSYFLKRQYSHWGVSSGRLSVIENLPAKKLLDVQKQRSQKELVVGYFGQLNRWKGVDLLVEAVHVARNQGIDLILEINGPSAGIQLLKSDGIFWNGRYEPEQLWERMARVDVVAMSSIWFENSPMVIQESYQCSKPVIAPDLGGMAEKVHDGRTGLLFVNGDIGSLADKMICLAQNRSLLASLAKGAAYHAIPRQRLINAHQRFYQRLLI